MLLNVKNVINTTGANFVGNINNFFKKISIDSRLIQKGDLFIALLGKNFDGHHFLQEAIKNGATGFIIRKTWNYKKINTFTFQMSLFIVDDTLIALGNIAKLWRSFFSIPIVAITGTSGKTTTKEMISHIINNDKNLIKTQGNLNNLIGVPISILQMNKKHKIGIFELGTSYLGEIARLTEIIAPNIGLITNVGEAHLQGLKSLNGVFKEKTDLFRVMNNFGTAIINLDDELLNTQNYWYGNKITFGIKNNLAQIKAINIQQNKNYGISFYLVFQDFCQKIKMSIYGKHNVYNALGAIACAYALNIPFNIICKRLMSFKTINGRLQLIKLANGVFLFNDAYNANPFSVISVLNTLKNLKDKSKIILILGDMLELGENSALLHEKIGKFIAQSNVDMLFIKGSFALNVVKGAINNGMHKSKIIIENDLQNIALSISSIINDGDLILVKGSRKTNIDQIIKYFIILNNIKI